MHIPIYQVDAFTSQLFAGNPAAVCALPYWLDDTLLQSIAAENNLSETAFFTGSGNEYELRWFTPKTEVDLCGHATLATAHVLFRVMGITDYSVTFHTKSGVLKVQDKQDTLAMDFPVWRPEPVEPDPALLAALQGVGKPEQVLAYRDYVVVYSNQEQIEQLHPDMQLLRALDKHAVVVTAPGTGDVDFVSRFFAPAWGLDEDPVTGSAHSSLIPYWAERLGKDALHAVQLSERGGELFCSAGCDRVAIAGRAQLYMQGKIYLPD